VTPKRAEQSSNTTASCGLLAKAGRATAAVSRDRHENTTRRCRDFLDKAAALARDWELQQLEAGERGALVAVMMAPALSVAVV
jgi:hypothetical protein